ncbi:uncharacterized protein LOC127010697 [Drosophila biarmipes]|uniref:uncharacterized protein LOC127010697 n=1 Tax=Drosophila biarmipes TaxID=125945 RepID=UPI0021CC81C3|nr:uncharacterized protein LOC127010697 [Drosophila biarmipes]
MCIINIVWLRDAVLPLLTPQIPHSSPSSYSRREVKPLLLALPKCKPNSIFGPIVWLLLCLAPGSRWKMEIGIRRERIKGRGPKPRSLGHQSILGGECPAPRP